MKTTKKQTLAVNSLLFILLALFFLSGSLMWSQHEQYHNQHGMGWMVPANSQNISAPFSNNLNE